MKMKKLACAALAGTMAMSLTTTAFAVTAVKPVAESTESSFEVELEGMSYTPVIRVQVTQAGSIYVNPTKSTVAGTMTKALDGSIDLEYSFEGKSVVSTPILIRSDTDKDLSVNATVDATVPKSSGITIIEKATMTNLTEKQVYLYVTGNANALGDSDALKTTTGQDGNVSGGLTADNSIGSASTTSTAKNTLTPADGGKSAHIEATGVATIDAATQNKNATTGKLETVEPQYGVVVVSGETAGKATGWTEDDIVNATVALTFSIA